MREADIGRFAPESSPESDDPRVALVTQEHRISERQQQVSESAIRPRRRQACSREKALRSYGHCRSCNSPLRLLNAVRAVRLA